MVFHTYVQSMIRRLSRHLSPLWTSGFWIMMENPQYFKPKPQEMKYIRNEAGPYLIAMGATFILVTCILSINYFLRKKRKAKSIEKENEE